MVVPRTSERLESPEASGGRLSSDWSEWGSRAAPSLSLPQPGATIAGKYRLLQQLGVGGTGVVFRAHHLGLASEVAIKLIHPSLVGNEQSLRRFRREARAVFFLRHPNVVRVLDFGDDPLPHIVMEYVTATSLGDFLADLSVPPPLALVAGVSRQILSALEAAHTQHIVHRDLKPDNVLLVKGADGRFSEAKVVDFGLAHFEDERDLGPTLTQDGVIAGTPAYMSPEQCRSLAVGPSSDLYAFGCLLTELLQLSPPFANAPSALLLSQQMFMPPPRLERPDGSEPISEGLEELRLALLAKHPHQRPESAARVSELLELALGDVSPSRKVKASRGSPTPPSPRDTTETRRRILVSLITDDGASLSRDTETGLAMQGIELVEDEHSQMRLLIDSRELEQVRAQLLRLKAADSDRPIVVVTHRAAASDVLQLVEAGAADLLKPPLSPDTLASALLRVARRAAPPGG